MTDLNAALQAWESRMHTASKGATTVPPPHTLGGVSEVNKGPAVDAGAVLT